MTPKPWALKARCCRCWRGRTRGPETLFPPHV